MGANRQWRHNGQLSRAKAPEEREHLITSNIQKCWNKFFIFLKGILRITSPKQRSETRLGSRDSYAKAPEEREHLITSSQKCWNKFVIFLKGTFTDYESQTTLRNSTWIERFVRLKHARICNHMCIEKKRKSWRALLNDYSTRNTTISKITISRTGRRLLIIVGLRAFTPSINSAQRNLNIWNEDQVNGASEKFRWISGLM